MNSRHVSLDSAHSQSYLTQRPSLFVLLAVFSRVTVICYTWKKLFPNDRQNEHLLSEFSEWASIKQRNSFKLVSRHTWNSLAAFSYFLL